MPASFPSLSATIGLPDGCEPRAISRSAHFIDIGNVASLLCSEHAGWITGQVIYADGGVSLMNPEVPPETQLG